MRVLIKAEIPNDVGNQRIKDGSLQAILGSVMETLKPEATYFTLSNGHRTGYFVADLNEASDIPRLLEPLFLGLGAKLEVVPVMTPDDLQKASPDMGKAVETYGKYV
jgi:hypothetical protein